MAPDGELGLPRGMERSRLHAVLPHQVSASPPAHESPFIIQQSSDPGLIRDLNLYWGHRRGQGLPSARTPFPWTLTQM